MTQDITYKKKSLEGNHCYRADFKYTHDNPYDDKLEAFDMFVMRDDESEQYVGHWHEKVFGTVAPLDVEIGTGFGEFMLDYCQKNPDRVFVGMDHRFKRSLMVAKKLNKLEVKNFRYLRARGERMEFIFAEGEVNRIFYFFPDPWPKTRHHKKRLFQKPFLDAAYKALGKGGQIHIKTDHDGYYEWMLRELQSETRFKILLQSRNLRSEFPEHFLSQFTTKFEKIFLSQGTLIKAIVLETLKT